MANGGVTPLFLTKHGKTYIIKELSLSSIILVFKVAVVRFVYIRKRGGTLAGVRCSQDCGLKHGQNGRAACAVGARHLPGAKGRLERRFWLKCAFFDRNRR
jgi:hypothetical protein